MRLTARRARRMRERVAANRCPVGPGITHWWQYGAAPDPTSFGAVVEWMECEKCGTWNR